jgi:16S rRNA (adenine1518-N6/adenine1519-N6)-dimethyltransferase
VNHDSPAEIRATLERLGLRPHRRWGQNFLINPHARARIAEILDPDATDTVWEVGPGLGALTAELLRRAYKVLAFELDWGLIRFLQADLAEEGRFELVPGDVLKTWRPELKRRGLPERIAGNLPYASASALIGDLAEANARPPRMVFTVQRELAQRMTAAPGGKAFSSFSVLCQVTYRVEPRMELNPGSFYPAPEVSSTVVLLTPREDLPQPGDRRQFVRLVRALFASRRKTIWNNLLAGGFARGDREQPVRAALAASGVDPRQRGEALAPEQFVELSDRLAKLG